MEILTVEQLAAALSMTKRQIYGLTNARARAKMKTPFPVIRINGNLRFLRSSVEQYLEQLSKENQ